MSLHQQLLDATEPLMAGEHYSVARLAGPIAALRAVVELHAPVEHAFGTLCGACSQTQGNGVLLFVAAPCTEALTIARELGIEAL